MLHQNKSSDKSITQLYLAALQQAESGNESILKDLCKQIILLGAELDVTEKEEYQCILNYAREQLDIAGTDKDENKTATNPKEKEQPEKVATLTNKTAKKKKRKKKNKNKSGDLSELQIRLRMYEEYVAALNCNLDKKKSCITTLLEEHNVLIKQLYKQIQIASGEIKNQYIDQLTKCIINLYQDLVFCNQEKLTIYPSLAPNEQYDLYKIIQKHSEYLQKIGDKNYPKVNQCADILITNMNNQHPEFVPAVHDYVLLLEKQGQQPQLIIMTYLNSILNGGIQSFEFLIQYIQKNYKSKIADEMIDKLSDLHKKSNENKLYSEIGIENMEWVINHFYLVLNPQLKLIESDVLMFKFAHSLSKSNIPQQYKNHALQKSKEFLKQLEISTNTGIASAAKKFANGVQKELEKQTESEKKKKRKKVKKKGKQIKPAEKKEVDSDQRNESENEDKNSVEERIEKVYQSLKTAGSFEKLTIAYEIYVKLLNENIEIKKSKLTELCQTHFVVIQLLHQRIQAVSSESNSRLNNQLTTCLLNLNHDLLLCRQEEMSIFPRLDVTEKYKLVNIVKHHLDYLLQINENDKNTKILYDMYKSLLCHISMSHREFVPGVHDHILEQKKGVAQGDNKHDLYFTHQYLTCIVSGGKEAFDHLIQYIQTSKYKSPTAKKIVKILKELREKYNNNEVYSADSIQKMEWVINHLFLALKLEKSHNDEAMLNIFAVTLYKQPYSPDECNIAALLRSEQILSELENSTNKDIRALAKKSRIEAKQEIEKYNKKQATQETNEKSTEAQTGKQKQKKGKEKEKEKEKEVQKNKVEINTNEINEAFLAIEKADDIDACINTYENYVNLLNTDTKIKELHLTSLCDAHHLIIKKLNKIIESSSGDQKTHYMNKLTECIIHLCNDLFLCKEVFPHLEVEEMHALQSIIGKHFADLQMRNVNEEILSRVRTCRVIIIETIRNKYPDYVPTCHDYALLAEDLGKSDVIINSYMVCILTGGKEALEHLIDYIKRKNIKTNDKIEMMIEKLSELMKQYRRNEAYSRNGMKNMEWLINNIHLLHESPSQLQSDTLMLAYSYSLCSQPYNTSDQRNQNALLRCEELLTLLMNSKENEIAPKARAKRIIVKDLIKENMQNKDKQEKQSKSNTRRRGNQRGRNTGRLVKKENNRIESRADSQSTNEITEKPDVVRSEPSVETIIADQDETSNERNIEQTETQVHEKAQSTSNQEVATIQEEEISETNVEVENDDGQKETSNVQIKEEEQIQEGEVLPNVPDEETSIEDEAQKGIVVDETEVLDEEKILERVFDGVEAGTTNQNLDSLTQEKSEKEESVAVEVLDDLSNIQSDKDIPTQEKTVSKETEGKMDDSQREKSDEQIIEQELIEVATQDKDKNSREKEKEKEKEEEYSTEYQDQYQSVNPQPKSQDDYYEKSGEKEISAEPTYFSSSDEITSQPIIVDKLSYLPRNALIVLTCFPQGQAFMVGSHARALLLLKQCKTNINPNLIKNRRDIDIVVAGSPPPDNVVEFQGYAFTRSPYNPCLYQNSHLNVDVYYSERLAHSMRKDAVGDFALFMKTGNRDALGRDFPPNALYVDAYGNVIDPLDGIAYYDFLNNNIRTIIDPSISFFYDPRRILRYLLFALFLQKETYSPEFLKTFYPALDDISKINNVEIYSILKKFFMNGHAVNGLLLIHRYQLYQKFFSGISEKRFEWLRQQLELTDKLYDMSMTLAGKSDLYAPKVFSLFVAARILTDIDNGCFIPDNIPPLYIKRIMEEFRFPESMIEKIIGRQNPQGQYLDPPLVYFIKKLVREGRNRKDQGSDVDQKTELADQSNVPTAPPPALSDTMNSQSPSIQVCKYVRNQHTMYAPLTQKKLKHFGRLKKPGKKGNPWRHSI